MYQILLISPEKQELQISEVFVTNDFSKIMVCPREQGELRQCVHLTDKEGGVQFNCAILYGRFSCKAPISSIF